MIVFGICFLCFGLGILRTEMVEWNFENNILTQLAKNQEDVEIQGKVLKEPEFREESVRLVIKVKEIKWEKGQEEGIGRILVTINPYTDVDFGDEIKIFGAISQPKDFEDFNYKDFLKKDGILATSYFPEIEITKKKNYETLPSFLLMAKILAVKNRFRNLVYQNLSPPQSSILAAILFGDKGKMSQEWKEKLNITGVRHITAISGMHIVILSGILIWLGMALRLNRGQAFYFAIVFLWLFIIMIGFQSSALRAGIMGSLLLICQKIGRKGAAERTIFLTAAVMLTFNPLILKSDVGFQLSFLATLGIIYLMPFFQEVLAKIKSVKNFPYLVSLLAMTFAAQVFTLPILIYNFGYISLISPITNILIVPILSYIMGSGIIFLAAGILWQPLAWFFSLPAWVLMNYLIGVVDFFSKFSFVALTFKVSWFWAVISYLILGYWVFYLQRVKEPRIFEY